MMNYHDPQQAWENRLADSFDLMGAGFATLGPNYNTSMYQARLQALQHALQTAQTTLQGQEVLEVGCGTGFYTDFCRKQAVASYTGVDITSVSVQRLQAQYPAFKFIQADITEPSFDLGRQFDLVLVADVLFHIVDDNRFQHAALNLSQAIRPNGLLVLSDVLSVSSIRTAAHCYFRSFAHYQKVLEAHGLAIRHLEPIFALLHPPVQMPGTDLFWKIYTFLWHRLLLRLARWDQFDRLLPRILSRLDTHFFLARSNVKTPNSKWLIAVKTV